ncbi:DUF418 domain-containing protein [Amnibacterium soli]|uniref:DUF418 domain-containing protein n=1 Tax=Amnibacterium soli TaxID=1282736 RepID=UPI0031ED7E2C
MSRRFAGVDAARGLAILGMLWAHTAADGTRQSLADGRSSVLFATLLGCSVGLITGGARPRRGADRREAVASVALRGLALIVLGLMLWTLGTPVAVVLDTYGALLLVLLPIVFAPTAVIAAVGVVAALAGPLVVQAVGEDLSTPFSPQRLPSLLGEWFVTGYYPGVVFAAYLCAGLVVARADLARRATLVAMLGGGAAASALGYGGAALLGLDASAHANSTAEVLGSGGLAIAVVGGLELLCTAEATARPARTVLAPLVAAGRMPLTIYTAQLIVLTVWLATPAAGTPPWIESWALLGGLALASVVAAMIWQRFVGKGPLERVLTRLTTFPARRA